VIKKVQDQLVGQLPALNSALEQQKLEPIQAISEADWQKQHQEAPPQPKVSTLQMRERD
jgi:hypothetical protein